MSHPLYPTYASTGVPWLGDIPAHWESKRLKLLFEIVKQIANMDGLDVLSVTQKGIRIKNVESNEGQLSMDYSKYQIVNPGDFVMNHMDLLTGYVDVSKYHGVTSPDYRAFKLRDQRNSRRFFLYLLQNCYHQRLFFPFGQGSSHLGRWRLPTESFNEFTFPVPPPEEQTAIVTFLDRETGKIAALVEGQRRLVELLKEKRQTVISHAVTKGLDPDAPMKDSGIEWLGEVPEHWEIKALRHVVSSISSGTSVNAIDTPAGEKEFGVLKTSCVYTGQFEADENKAVLPEEYGRVSCPVKAETLIVSRMNTPELVGAAGLVKATAANLFLPDRLWQIEFTSALPAFVHFWTMTRNYRAQVQVACAGTSSSMQNLSQDQFMSFVLAIPPVDEQHSIAAFLDRETQKLLSLSIQAELAIELLQERRAALISAAVTGKIDVRGQSTSTVVTPDFRQSRKLVAAKIVEDLSDQKTFGRVKLQKLLYLAEAHGGIHELSGHYVREAAGPLDREMVREVETALQACGHVVIEQPEGRGTAVNYQLRGTRGAFQTDLATLLGNRISALSELIETVGALDTRGAEAVATLYAVWNDALASGTVPSDDEIIREVLNEWHPKKAETFTVADLKHWMAWMRRNGLKPKGNAPVTSTGRLFV